MSVSNGPTSRRLSERTYEVVSSSLFTDALFSIAEMQKQPTGALAVEQIKDMWHMHTVDYESAFKGKKMLAHAKIWMKFEGVMLTWNKPDREGQIMCDSTYVRCLK